eukprot:1175741-Prorocentrum_minimum.AAC.2
MLHGRDLLLNDHHFAVFLDHLLHQLVERGLRRPPEHLLDTGRVGVKQVHLRRSVELGIYSDHNGAGFRDIAHLIDIIPSPADGQAYAAESDLAKLAHGTRAARADDEIVRLVVLKNEPHRHHVVTGVPPVPLRVDVTQEQALLEAVFDPCHRPRDLPGHEVVPAARALVVEENPVGSKDVVSLSVVNDGPERHQLADRVR